MGFDVPNTEFKDWFNSFKLPMTYASQCEHHVGGLCTIYIHLDDMFECSFGNCPKTKYLDPNIFGDTV